MTSYGSNLGGLILGPNVIPAKAGIHRTVAVEQPPKTERYPLTVTSARLIRPVRVYATNNTFALMVAQYLRAILYQSGVCLLSRSMRCIQPEKRRIRRGASDIRTIP